MPTAVATDRRHDGRAVVAWAGVVAVGIVGGGWLTSRHPKFHTDAAPFHGHWQLEVRAAALVPVVLAGVLVAAGPWAAARLPWRRLLVAAPLAAFGWAVALSVSVGGHGFATPMRDRAGYLAGVPLVDGRFLRTFTSAWPAFRPTSRGTHRAWS